MSPQEQHPGHMPSFDEANAAYNEIVEHNRRHTGMGAGLANLFMGAVGAESVEQSVTEGDMHGELQGILHEDTFMRIGVAIAPSGSYMGNGEGERTSSAALVPSIANTELFKEFLSGIKPEDVEIGEDQLLLSSVLGNLQHTIATCFDPSVIEKLDPEIREIVTRHGEDALRTFIAIAPEYQRLGLDAESLRENFGVEPEVEGWMVLGKNPTQEERDKKERLDKQRQEHDRYKQAHDIVKTQETLEAYVAYWGRDLLPEFIVADRWQYIKKPENQLFGPAEWHTDGYERQWRHALEFLAGLEQDDRTKEFGEEVRQNLIRSLDVAVGAIDDGENEKPAYVTSQRDDLANIRNALSGQPFDAERLQDYTKEPDYNP